MAESGLIDLINDIFGTGGLVDTSDLLDAAASIADVVSREDFIVSLDGTDGGETLVATDSAGQMLRGLGGDDIVLGGQGNDFVNGNSGDDLVDGGAGDDRVLGGQGDDDVLGGQGNDIVNGNLGEDTVLGATGDDDVRGGQGDDVLQGNDGDDTLNGNLGDDLLTGGSGADVFKFSANSGTDGIVDYEDGVDSLLFSTDLFTTADQVIAAASTGTFGAVISFNDGGSVTIVNLAVDQLSADEIDFF